MGESHSCCQLVLPGVSRLEVDPTLSVAGCAKALVTCTPHRIPCPAPRLTPWWALRLSQGWFLGSPVNCHLGCLCYQGCSPCCHAVPWCDCHSCASSWGCFCGQACCLCCVWHQIVCWGGHCYQDGVRDLVYWQYQALCCPHRMP